MSHELIVINAGGQPELPALIIGAGEPAAAIPRNLHREYPQQEHARGLWTGGGGDRHDDD